MSRLPNPQLRNAAKAALRLREKKVPWDDVLLRLRPQFPSLKVAKVTLRKECAKVQRESDGISLAAAYERAEKAVKSIGGKYETHQVDRRIIPFGYQKLIRPMKGTNQRFGCVVIRWDEPGSAVTPSGFESTIQKVSDASVSSLIVAAFEARAGGASLKKINEKVAASGHKVSTSGIAKILRNPIYKGLILPPDRSNAKYLPAREHPMRAFLVEDLAFVEDDLWENVQETFGTRETPTEKSEIGDFPLRRLIYCADCGSRLRHRRRISHGYAQRIYYCGQEREHPGIHQGAIKSPNVAGAKIEKLVSRILRLPGGKGRSAIKLEREFQRRVTRVTITHTRHLVPACTGSKSVKLISGSVNLTDGSQIDFDSETFDAGSLRQRALAILDRCERRGATSNEIACQLRRRPCNAWSCLAMARTLGNARNHPTGKGFISPRFWDAALPVFKAVQHDNHIAKMLAEIHRHLQLSGLPQTRAQIRKAVGPVTHAAFVAAMREGRIIRAPQQSGYVLNPIISQSLTPASADGIGEKP